MIRRVQPSPGIERDSNSGMDPMYSTVANCRIVRQVFTPPVGVASYAMGVPFGPVGILLLAVGEAWAQDSAADRAALVALYNSTGGPNWRDNRNWLSDRPLSEWYGVTVSNGRVDGTAFNATG